MRATLVGCLTLGISALPGCGSLGDLLRFDAGTGKTDGGTGGGSTDAGGGSDATTLRRYAGAASRGDVVALELDFDAGLLSAFNETTRASERLEYVELEGDLVGIKRGATDAGFAFAVELPGALLATSFPVGNPEMNLTVATSADADNTGREGVIAGTYTWVRMSDEAVNGVQDVKEWGALVVSADGGWGKYTFATGEGLFATPSPPPGLPFVTAVAPEDFPAPFPPSYPAIERGVWDVSTTKRARLRVGVSPFESVKLGAFTRASEGASIFVLDLGETRGFVLGLEGSGGAARVPLEALAGTFAFVDLVRTEGGATRGAGHFVFTLSGTGSYVRVDAAGARSGGALRDVAPCANVQNAFLVGQMDWSDPELASDDLVLRLAVAGDALFAIGFDGSGSFVSYVVGVRIGGAGAAADGGS